MPEILQLEEFFVTRLHADWHERAAVHSPADTRMRYVFDYDVLRKTDSPHSFALRLRFQMGPKEEPKVGYSIDAEIVGVFQFPETMDEQQMQGLIRINGGTILYGLLRGQVAALTGSFPEGKCTLPAVYMNEIVAAIEKRKSAALKRQSAKRGPAQTTKGKRRKSKAK